MSHFLLETFEVEESTAQLLAMTPQSLKEMGVVEGMEEGNYASSVDGSKDGTLCCDLGLTLLPGSQVLNELNTRLKLITESNPTDGFGRNNQSRSLQHQKSYRRINLFYAFNTLSPFQSKPHAESKNLHQIGRAHV